jgi:hypothetical protein
VDIPVEFVNVHLVVFAFERFHVLFELLLSDDLLDADHFVGLRR